MAESIEPVSVAAEQTISGLAAMAIDLTPRSKRLLTKRRVAALGMSMVMVSGGVRYGAYSDEQRAAFAPPPDCTVATEIGDQYEAELKRDQALRTDRQDDKTVLSRTADSLRTPHDSSLQATLEYLLLADNHELRQSVQLPGSGIMVNLHSNEAMVLDAELLDELWADVMNPNHYRAGLQQEKFRCHQRNFYELRRHEDSVLNIRVSVTGHDDTNKYGFVFRDITSPDVVEARFVVNQVEDLNDVGHMAHEIGGHVTEWFDRVPMLPRIRGLENLANEVEDSAKDRWKDRDFELFTSTDEL